MHEAAAEEFFFLSALHCTYIMSLQICQITMLLALSGMLQDLTVSYQMFSWQCMDPCIVI